MESSSLITPNIATFAVTILNIGVLCVLLRAILFKPVSKFIEARAKKIEDAIDQADNDKAEAKLLLSQCEERLKHADDEAESIINAARVRAAKEVERIMLDRKKSADMMMAAARSQMEIEREAALEKFKAEAVMLILAASSKLIARDIEKGDSQHFVNLLLEELAAERTAQKRDR